MLCVEHKWVLSLIEYFESNYMHRMCSTDEYKALNELVGGVLSVIDAHEKRLRNLGE